MLAPDIRSRLLPMTPEIKCKVAISMTVILSLLATISIEAPREWSQDGISAHFLNTGVAVHIVNRI